MTNFEMEQREPKNNKHTGFHSTLFVCLFKLLKRGIFFRQRSLKSQLPGIAWVLELRVDNWD